MRYNLHNLKGKNLMKKSNEKGKNIIIGILVGVNIILLALVIWFANNRDNDINKTTTSDDNSQNNFENDTISDNNVSNNNIAINLSINNVTVSKDAPNEKIQVTGIIDLSYDNNKYEGVTLSGYCIGSSNEKYLIHGPSDGRAFFSNDGNNNLTLSEDITDIKYADGVVKPWSEDIDWDNVKIKYCKIEKMKALLKNSINYDDISLNIEKNFN